MSDTNDNIFPPDGPDKTTRACIRVYNDHFRQSFNNLYGKVLLTYGVQTLSHEEKNILIKMVREFDGFKEDNDPNEEHDFGAIEMGGVKYFFKINYYDSNYEFRSEYPETVGLTRRVLTIMMACEY